MTTIQVQPSKRPTPPAQDCRCTRCGNINRQTYPGQPCVWASGDPAELQADPGANCGGTLVSMGNAALTPAQLAAAYEEAWKVEEQAWDLYLSAIIAPSPITSLQSAEAFQRQREWRAAYRVYSAAFKAHFAAFTAEYGIGGAA